MNAYVINLAHRTDRWVEVERQKMLIPCRILRIEGVTPLNLGDQSPLHLPPPVLACFLSHKNALRVFAESDEDFALILEDDFYVQNQLLSENISLASDFGFDFLQIGYLKTTIFQAISIANKNSFDFFYKFGALLISRGLAPRFFRSKELFREQIGIPKRIVINDIRPGAHAYIVSRRFAIAMQEFNNPAYLSVDGLYIALGSMRTFKMGRLRKNLISQSGSPSSILQR